MVYGSKLFERVLCTEDLMVLFLKCGHLCSTLYVFMHFSAFNVSKVLFYIWQILYVFLNVLFSS